MSVIEEPLASQPLPKMPLAEQRFPRGVFSSLHGDTGKSGGYEIRPPRGFVSGNPARNLAISG
jgi:hypothetical protein